MKKIISAIVACLMILPCAILFAGCSKKDKWSGDLGIDLPHIYIETEGGKIPKDKENYVNCSFEITNTQDEKDSFAVTMKASTEEDDSVGIRLRGNSTMRRAKKPYRIKFDKKKSFFGLPKNKNWVLLADYLDPSCMRNYTAFELARKFESFEFTPSANHVILYLNGEFQGLYLLTEQPDEKNGRVGLEDESLDIDDEIDIPFMVEMDWSAEGTWGIDKIYLNDNYPPIEIKYPEPKDYKIEGRDDLDQETWNKVYTYIKDYVDAVFALLGNRNQGVTFNGKTVYLADLVDEDSLMDYLLVNEIMANNDNKDRGIKMYKHKGGLLKFGPVWDFDACAIKKWEGNPNQARYDLSVADNLYVLTGDIGKKWLAIGDNKQKMYDRYLEKRHVILELVDMLDDYKDYISKAGKIDAEKWYVWSKGMFESQYQFLKDFLLLRYDRLKALLKP